MGTKKQAQCRLITGKKQRNFHLIFSFLKYAGQHSFMVEDSMVILVTDRM